VSLVTVGDVPGTAEGYALSFTVKRFVLATLVEWTSPVIPKKEALPVLGCIRITVSPDQMQFAATDMERTVFAVSPSLSTESSGVVFLPAQRLKAILAEAPDKDVTIRVRRDFAEVEAGGVTWSLKLPASTQYPKLPDFGTAQFRPARREHLLGALRTVRHAAGRDSSNPASAQVRIAESDGLMYATASSGGRYCRMPVPGFPFSTSVPTGALDELIRVLSTSKLDDTLVSLEGDTLAFRAGPVTLAVQLLMQQFPDADRLVLDPVRDSTDVLGVDRSELVQAVRRVRINADSTSSAVAFVLEDGSLTLEARDEVGNRAAETVQAAWGGGSRLVVLNAQFLLDLLAVYPASSCTFKVSKDVRKRRVALLLEDEDSGVTGVIPQMQPSLVGR
jgi:DNA polymerase III sliding clamp (beta) subunit (PCNA family)